MLGVFETIAELLAPTRCAGCELPGEVLCERCTSDALSIVSAEACPRCGAPFGRLVCTECWHTEYSFEAAVCLGEFVAPLARVVALHKDGPEQRLGMVLGALLGARVCAAWPRWAQVVTWVPASPAAMRRRRFDHARGIAEAVAAEMGVPSAALLDRARALDQRSLGREQRARNAEGTFASAGAVGQRRVLLVDDVLTTGATLDAAAAVLLDAGATAVRAAAVARTW